MLICIGYKYNLIVLLLLLMLYQVQVLLLPVAAGKGYTGTQKKFQCLFHLQLRAANNEIARFKEVEAIEPSI